MVKDDQSAVNDDRIMLKHQVNEKKLILNDELLNNFSIILIECCYQACFLINWL